MRSLGHVSGAILLCVALAGCGGGGGSSNPPANNPAPIQVSLLQYYAMHVGDQWQYSETSGIWHRIVTGQTTINGLPAFVIDNQATGWQDTGYSWVGGTVFRDYGWDEGATTKRGSPPAELPATMTVGVPSQATGRWLVNGVDVGAYNLTITVEGTGSVTVPAGTFADCIILKTDLIWASESEHSRVWFARGVGEVKSEHQDGTHARVLTGAVVSGHTYGIIQ